MVENVALITFSVAVFVLGLPTPLSADESPLKRPIEAFYSNDEPALSAILRFGRENNIPLGLVAGDPLCSTTITGLRVEHATAEAVLARFRQVLPSYRWDAGDGAVVVAPAEIPTPVSRLLAVVPPQYRIAADTLQGQLVWAWMDIRAALRPREGTAFSILSSPDSVRWPVLAVNGITVRQLLNRLVARNKGGAWVLFPFPDFDKVADRCPISVLDYTEKLPIQTVIPRCVGGQGP